MNYLTNLERLESEVGQLQDLRIEEARERDRLRSENHRLQTENWQLRQACGYPIPADKETPQNPFKCGVCDARAREMPWDETDGETRPDRPAGRL